VSIGRLERVDSDGAVRTLHNTAGPRESTVSDDGSALLRDVEHFISRFVVLPARMLLPLALWSLGTHLFDAFDSFTYLVITSPTPRCGKSRVQEILALLCANSERTSNISEAAMFRLIERFKPTLLLDEMEQIREKGERAQILRNLLNAGNRRDAVAIRCAEAGKSIERCSVYCPKALAAIGSLPDTITDRAIVIRMQRRTREEKIERFVFQRVEPQGREILERMAAWSQRHQGTVQTAYANAPDLDFLEDRDAESWAPLFSILAVANSSRLAELRGCAEALCGQKQDDTAEEHFAVRLIRDATGVLRDDEKHIASADLLARLRTLEDSAWGDPSFDARRLAKHLRAFGLKSKPVRIGDSTPRGYIAAEIRERAFRYSGGPSATSATRNENKDLGIKEVADVADTGALCEGGHDGAD
jgi:hypothetical protein